MSAHPAESDARVGPVIEGPYERHRVTDTWWWERPSGGDIAYNWPDVLFRAQRIWGGRIKVIRMIEHSETAVHAVIPPVVGQS